MSDSTLDQERQKRRQVILEGISQDSKQTDIAAQLGVSRWVIKNDIKYMRINRDSELKRAMEGREQVRAEKRPDLASASEARERVSPVQSSSSFASRIRLLDE